MRFFCSFVYPVERLEGKKQRVLFVCGHKKSGGVGRPGNVYARTALWTVRLCFFSLFVPASAAAYLDPGTGSLLLSALLGLAATFFFTVKKILYACREFYWRLRGTARPSGQQSIVFYSEGAQYWPTFKPIIEALLSRHESVSYFSSDKNDPGLALQDPGLSCRYIGQGGHAYALLNRLEADICVLTTPGLDVLQIKRSECVKHYAHVMHSITDAAFYLVYSFDYFDSVFCAGPHQIRSLRYLESLRASPKKKLFASGCPYMDVLAAALDSARGTKLALEPAETAGLGAGCVPGAQGGGPPENNGLLRRGRARLLIAPTWGKNGLLRRFGLDLLLPLAEGGYPILVRPHPQSALSEPLLLARLKKRLEGFANVAWDERPSPLWAMLASDILISDLSGIVFDYALILERPVLTVAFTPDLRGQDAADLPWAAWELDILPRLGAHIPLDALERLPEILDELARKSSFPEEMRRLRAQALYSFRSSGQTIAGQLLDIKKELDPIR